MKNKITGTMMIRSEDRMTYRPCCHSANGDTVIPKVCIYNYECLKCAFDQWLDELEDSHGVPAAA
jgi:hypothetical protein